MYLICLNVQFLAFMWKTLETQSISPHRPHLTMNHMISVNRQCFFFYISMWMSDAARRIAMNRMYEYRTTEYTVADSLMECRVQRRIDYEFSNWTQYMGRHRKCTENEKLCSPFSIRLMNNFLLIRKLFLFF